MNSLFYCANDKLANSLTRYFFYSDLEIDSFIRKNDYLFWDAMHPINDRVLIMAESYKELIIVPLVYLNNNSKKQCINLLDFQNLRTNIKYAVKNYSQYALLYLKKVQDKLKDFFKGHGQEAIFSVLNKTLSGFKNGLNPFLQKEYNQKDLDDKFLKPGQKNWKLFIERFKKYNDFLYICGLREEVKKINNFIDKLEPIIQYIDQNRIEKSIEEKGNIVSSLEKIDELLMKMKKKIESYNDI